MCVCTYWLKQWTVCSWGVALDSSLVNCIPTAVHTDSPFLATFMWTASHWWDVCPSRGGVTVWSIYSNYLWLIQVGTSGGHYGEDKLKVTARRIERWLPQSAFTCAMVTLSTAVAMMWITVQNVKKLYHSIQTNVPKSGVIEREGVMCSQQTKWSQLSILNRQRGGNVEAVQGPKYKENYDV